MRKPDFFIVGAPKCGTSAMNYYLMQHPEVFIGRKGGRSTRREDHMKYLDLSIHEVKEFHFFGSDLNFRSPRISEEEYLSYFSGATSEKRVGEASVWYLYSKRAAAEIREFSPHADIVIMLRNPVDMMYSQYSQMVYRGYENLFSFEDALDAEEERKRGINIPDTVPLIENLLYREIVQYAQQVQRYLDVFTREKVHIIIFDDFRRDTAGVYTDTLRFLGVNEDYRPDLRVVNPNKRLRSPRLTSFLQKPPHIVRWLADVLLPQKLCQALFRELSRFNIRYESRPPMDPQLRQRLQAELAPEVERLNDLIGRDLTHWIRS